MEENKTFDSVTENVPKEEGTSFDIRTIFTLLVLNWPWFLVSLVICTLSAFLYLRYQPAEGGTMPDMTPVNPRYYDDGVATRYFNTFGLLYNHKAALAAVPEGWRLPTDEDWIKLAENTNSDIRKAINLGLAGCFIDDELFIQLHNVEYYTYIYGYYWTATTDDTKTGENFAYYRKLTWNKAGSERESMKKSTYMSVRLVRDV